MLVLACAVFLLLVVPALLLWLGRAIQANTDGRSRAGIARTRTTGLPQPRARHGAEADAAAWYRRPMLPAFGRATPAE